MFSTVLKKVWIKHCRANLFICSVDDVGKTFAYFINVDNVGEMLELSEAIRDYHDGTDFPCMVS